jgi:hypothetical protein
MAPDAWQVLVDAGAMARQPDVLVVSTRELLLALVGREGSAQAMLARFGVTTQRVRDAGTGWGTIVGAADDRP